MKLFPFLLLLPILLLQGCSTIRPPQPSPSPPPEIAIPLPNYIDLTEFTTDCDRYKCSGQLHLPILVVTESHLNTTTMKKRIIPVDVPECPIIETGYDKAAFLYEKRVIPSEGHSDYFILHYVIPLKTGTFSIKFKNSCQIRGNTYTVKVSG
ncbi:MAG: hypothetical protein ABIG96_02605 [Candidatus Micrarchaeota archaeon]